jgi:hypothetical protein
LTTSAVKTCLSSHNVCLSNQAKYNTSIDGNEEQNPVLCVNEKIVAETTRLG